MQGRDLMAEDAANLPVLIEDAGIAFAAPGAPTASRTLVHEGWRLTVFEGSDLGELYDLGRDPHELVNLWAAPEAAGQRAELMYRMVERQIALQNTSLVSTHQA